MGQIMAFVMVLKTFGMHSDEGSHRQCCMYLYVNGTGRPWEVLNREIQALATVKVADSARDKQGVGLR